MTTTTINPSPTLALLCFILLLVVAVVQCLWIVYRIAFSPPPLFALSCPSLTLVTHTQAATLCATPKCNHEKFLVLVSCIQEAVLPDTGSEKDVVSHQSDDDDGERRKKPAPAASLLCVQVPFVLRGKRSMTVVEPILQREVRRHRLAC